METQRKKRVAMTTQLKREVFMACLVRVLQGILPIGSFKAVAQDFGIDPKTVGKVWSSTMIQVIIDPPLIVSNLPTTAFDTKFKNANRKPKLSIDTVFQQMEDVDQESRGSLRFVTGQVGVSKTTIIRMIK
jgi:hypothetical protein